MGTVATILMNTGIIFGSTILFSAFFTLSLLWITKNTGEKGFDH